MSQDLKMLLQAAKRIKMNAIEREQQRQSFAYGNSHIENRRITRKTVAQEAAKLKRSNA